MNYILWDHFYSSFPPSPVTLHYRVRRTDLDNFAIKDLICFADKTGTAFRVDRQPRDRYSPTAGRNSSHFTASRHLLPKLIIQWLMGKISDHLTHHPLYCVCRYVCMLYYTAYISLESDASFFVLCYHVKNKSIMV